MLKINESFCSSPFIGLHAYDKYYLCCPGWLRTPIGTLDDDPVKVWKSPLAEKIRKSVFSGFGYCQNCPHLQEKMGAKIDIPFDYRDGPTALSLSHDLSCNLKCGFCRKELIYAKGNQKERLIQIQDNLISRFGQKIKNLVITQSGDAFASQVHMNLLSKMKSCDYPNLRITLCTNGLLIRNKWAQINGVASAIKEISISVDAATPETYLKNRGASWEQLCENLKFVSDIKKERNGDLVFVLRYCVQDNNWREMPDFVLLGESLGVDKIIFQNLEDLKTMSDFEARSVHLKNHNNNTAFRQMLLDPIFKKSFVKTQQLQKFGVL